VNASKENCQKAREHLLRVNDSIPADWRNSLSASLIFLDGFLDAAERKLPRESSFPKKKESAK